MTMKTVRGSAGLLLLAFAMVALVGWSGPSKTPDVTSEPLPCLTIGSQLVCFDGKPGTSVVCQQLTPDLILCTGSR